MMMNHWLSLKIAKRKREMPEILSEKNKEINSKMNVQISKWWKNEYKNR